MNWLVKGCARVELTLCLRLSNVKHTQAIQMAQRIRKWLAGVQKDRIVVCRQLLAVRYGKDNSHDMSHVNNDDGRLAAQMACSLSVITRLRQ